MARFSRLTRGVGTALALVSVIAACSTAAQPSGKASGALTVLAAASLTESFNDAKPILERDGLSITYSFAGSQSLVTQLQQGAPADVIATADQSTMQKLVDAGLVDPPTVFARSSLAIVVAPGNPKGVKSLADLARSDLAVVLADPSVPAGKLAQQVLDKAGVKVVPKSLELDVKSTLTKVTSGEADAAIVYVTDVRAAGAKVAGVTIPDEQNAVASYPIAVVKATGNRTGAEAFVNSARHGPVQDALMGRGFGPPS
ncbi:MAG: molybdate transport system substrate-binding protein [Acidimicrobiaceae bacterium]|jgi:molybdate transport system substrate-binding protein